MIEYWKSRGLASGKAKAFVCLLIFIPMLLLSRGASALTTASPTSINFGEIPVNTTSTTASVTVSTDFGATGITVSSPNSADFNVTNNCPTSLNGGASCVINVNFIPSIAGTQSDSFTVSGFDTVSEGTFSQTVSLTGVGTLGELSVAPTSLDFGSVPVNTTSSEQTITLSNTGSDSLTIESVAITGDYSKMENCIGTLDAGQDCTIQVLFEPTTTGTLDGAIDILGSNSAGTFQESVALTGIGTTAELLASPTNLDFGPIPVNETSDPQTVTLSNEGNSDLDIDSISTTGDFLQTNNCGNIIPAGQSCSVQVTFAPTSDGTLLGSLDINTQLGLTSVALSGSAEAADVSEETIVNLLLPYANGLPSVIETSKVIANACLSGRITERMQLDCNAVVQAASDGDSSTSTALMEITPERAIKANQATRQGGEAQSRNIGSRVAALRGGATGISFQGLGLRIDDQYLPVDQLAQYALKGKRGGGASADSSLTGSKFGVFLTGDISSGDREKTDLESGLDFNTYGITAGIDYRFSDQFILGGALGYMDSNTELDNDNGELDATGYSLSVYGTYYSEEAYFVDFSATYGTNDFDQNRRINYQLEGLADVSQEVSADYDGNMYGFFIGSGYDFNRGGWTFGPRLDLEYLKSKADGFTEQMSDPDADGGGWATHIDDNDQEWLTLQLGGKVSYAHSTSWGVLIPYGRVDWLHEFKQDSQVITGHFVSDPGGNDLLIFTDDPDRNYARLRLGASAQFQSGIAGFIDYGTILANSHWSGHTLSAGLRLEF